MTTEELLTQVHQQGLSYTIHWAFMYLAITTNSMSLVNQLDTIPKIKPFNGKQCYRIKLPANYTEES